MFEWLRSLFSAFGESEQTDGKKPRTVVWGT